MHFEDNGPVRSLVPDGINDARLIRTAFNIYDADLAGIPILPGSQMHPAHGGRAMIALRKMAVEYAKSNALEWPAPFHPQSCQQDLDLVVGMADASISSLVGIPE